MSDAVPMIIAGSAALVFTHRRLLTYLRFFQQEEYKEDRFLAWMGENDAHDTKGSRVAASAAIIIFILRVIGLTGPGLVNVVAAIALLNIASEEEDPRKSGKIRLNMTERARRIFRVSLLLTALAGGILLFLLCVLPLRGKIGWWWLVLLGLFQALPFCLVLAKKMLDPEEQAINEGFIAEAEEKFRRIRPFTVGITGSWGKTSTKNYLGQILQLSLGPTYYPPKGVNALLGVVRDVRERLQIGCPYAVLEVGAYHIGSISKVLNHFPVDAAIVTAVGPMHLDRFGSIENVYKAKSEMPQAVPVGGILVLNGDNEGTRRMANDFANRKVFLYGLEKDLGPLDCVGSDLRLTPEGTSFLITWKGEAYPASTPLIGRAAVSNILASFTLACALGADPKTVVAAIRALTPVDNRLELKRVGQAIHLRDAYNSNPEGFLTALEVLRDMPGSRRILVTPGMIELGERQFEENKRVATEAAKVCDYVLLVGKVNRDAWMQGLKSSSEAEVSTTESGASSRFDLEKILECENRESAFAQLSRLESPSDIVLIENDLPDLYESRLRL